MAERGKTWTKAETAKLIEAWSEKTVQSYLLGSKRNAKAFEKIVQVLAAHNFQRTVKQCQDKIKSLKRSYKSVIDKNRKSGAGNESDDDISVKDLPWFDAMHDILKDRAVTNPPHVMGSTNTQQTDVSHQDSKEDELLQFMPHDIEESGRDGIEEEQIQASSVEGSVGRQTPASLQPSSRVQTPTSGRQTPLSLQPSSRVQTPTAQLNSGRQTPSIEDSTESGPVIVTNSTGEKRTASQPTSKKKKRKFSKMERAEKASADMLEGIMKKLDEQRNDFVELERERMKHEEERAKRESLKDDQFMALFAQYVANTSQNPGPSASLQPHSRPVASSTVPSYGAIYSFDPETAEPESD